ncbi:MAG: hypothetical protein AAB963_02295, partial [Patescibacteria group bacterium]
AVFCPFLAVFHQRPSCAYTRIIPYFKEKNNPATLGAWHALTTPKAGQTKQPDFPRLFLKTIYFLN